MVRKNYNDMILKRIEKSFDKILPIAGIVSLLSAFAINFSTIPKLFVILDSIIGIILLVLSIFKNKISIEIKIIVSISMAMFIGVVSFMDGGFQSAGLTLIMISNVIVVLFLQRHISKFIGYLSVAIYFCLWLWAVTRYEGTIVKYSFTIWLIQLLIFVLYLIMLNIAVYAIRKYLLENVENLEDSVEKTFQLAYYDQLTKLPNQYYMKELLIDKSKDESKDKSGYLVFFSLKNLHLINSIYSEGTGDAVLVESARVLRSLHNGIELISRISGNEFALCIRKVKDFSGEIDYILERFYEDFDLPLMTKKVEFYISYIECDHSIDILECYQQCATALTYAKTHRCDFPVHYDKKFDDILKHDEALKDEIEKAILNKSFEVYFQEQVNAQTMKVTGVEALARWQSPVLGWIMPKDFIPVIERINQSENFGNVMLDIIMKHYGALCNKYGQQIQLSINISPSHLTSRAFLFVLKDNLLKHKVKAENITLEITEEVMIEGIDIIDLRLQEIKNTGVKISLDDFGSGYSSLNYLTSLPIDELKIDKSFVEQVVDNKKISIMLSKLIELAKAYELNIVAEGVETEVQYKLLKKLGCHEIQGYYFSKPSPL